MNCFDAALDRAFDQRARVGGVVEIIAERVGHRFRHDDLGGEMRDGVDPARARSRRATSSASPKSPTISSTPSGTAQAIAGREIVEHDDLLARRRAAPAPCGRRYSRRRRSRARSSQVLRRAAHRRLTNLRQVPYSVKAVAESCTHGAARPVRAQGEAVSMPKTIRKAVLPVAGLGTRFLPATKTVPKEMLTVVDRPILQHVVDEAMAAGVEHFIFVTGRNKAVIEDHFDNAYELEDTLRRRGKTRSWRRCSRTCPTPAIAPSPASRRRSASATPSGARARSSATSRSRCCCRTW